jgi:hypothetical protein
VPDVTIRHCVMRVVRRGGWSWGEKPRRLVADAVRALPQLLAAELDGVFPDGADGDVSAPLRLDVRVDLAELRDWVKQASLGDGGVAAVPASFRAVRPSSRGHPGVAEALRRALVARHFETRLVTSQPPGPEPEPAVASDPRIRAAAVLNLLTAWRAAGALEALLRSLPDAAVVAWHRALLESAVEVLAPGASEGSEVAEDLDAVLAPLAERVAETSPVDRLRLRLRASVELASAAGVMPMQAAARAAIDALVVPEPEDLGARVRTEVHAARRSLTRRAAPGTEVRVSSALPFLLLGPLRRIGWLEVLDATFAASDLEGSLPALAVALATKVLPEPERGWRRSPAAVAATAAFAGDAEPRADAEIAGLARTAAPLTPALDATIRRSLLDGRRAVDPVLLCSAGSVRLLVDPQGVFLIAYAVEAVDVADRAVETNAPLFVPAEDADARILAVLDAAGVPFVTPAPPVRGERWRPVRGTRSPRLFTNGRSLTFLPPSREVADRARETWGEFDRRPIPGRPTDPALDRALALGAAIALGTIAWELWREREPTDPRLALERFGDLEGTVRFEEHRVHVRFPLGKRFRDLREAGFLEDVSRVPWLGFRSVVFSGG